jgi:LytS/YehU family sensor histidine kinase
MKTLFPFILLVLIHHFFLAPLIRKKLPLYVGLTVALFVLFGVWCFSPISRPAGAPPFPREPEFFDKPRPRGPMSPETSRLIMGILLVGVDLGVFFYIESRPKERRMKELEAENIRQQLESLRYQINPHFLMNTLNNIHALVDLDPEKAKESIEVFSKMMRVLLYEGNAPTIPLAKELDFIEHFISLMRLRYPEDAVRIEASFPEACPDAAVPPLAMASFVENAFKHGISYAADSFISIKVELLDGRVLFECANSSHPSEDSGQHGIGLENVRKRLSLLYGSSFLLSTREKEGCYDVLMILPSQPIIMAS